MAINIKNLEERIQKKVHLVDSNTSVDDLTDMVEAALLLTGSLKTYADSSELPTATGSNEKIGFIQDIKAIKFNNGKEWVGMASGEVSAPVPPTGPSFIFGGTNYGFIAGRRGSPGNSMERYLEKHSFASDTNATDHTGGYAVFTPTKGTRSAAGVSSDTHGYTMGGYHPPNAHNTIWKFPMASTMTGAATDVGDMTSARQRQTGANSETHGYAMGGWAPPASNIIERLPFATDENATDVGDLLATKHMGGGVSSPTDGYHLSGASPGYDNVIEKFPFASATTNTTDVGDVTVARALAGISSPTHGYGAGGTSAGDPTEDTIDKFPFASGGNATDVGNLAVGVWRSGGGQSTTNGYYYGGYNGSSYVDHIQKWPFASDTNASDVANLTQAGDEATANMQY